MVVYDNPQLFDEQSQMVKDKSFRVRENYKCMVKSKHTGSSLVRLTVRLSFSLLHYCWTVVGSALLCNH